MKDAKFLPVRTDPNCVQLCTEVRLVSPVSQMIEGLAGEGCCQMKQKMLFQQQFQ